MDKFVIVTRKRPNLKSNVEVEEDESTGIDNDNEVENDEDQNEDDEDEPGRKRSRQKNCNKFEHKYSSLWKNDYPWIRKSSLGKIIVVDIKLHVWFDDDFMLIIDYIMCIKRWLLLRLQSLQQGCIVQV